MGENDGASEGASVTASFEPFFVDDFVLVFLDFLEPLPPLPLLEVAAGEAVGEEDGISLLFESFLAADISTTPSTEVSAKIRRVTRIRNKFFMLSMV